MFDNAQIDSMMFTVIEMNILKHMFAFLSGNSSDRYNRLHTCNTVSETNHFLYYSHLYILMRAIEELVHTFLAYSTCLHILIHNWFYKG